MSHYLSANITRKLTELNITAPELVQKAGISNDDLDAIDSGIKPTATVLNKIATALGTNGVWLCMNGVNESDVDEEKKVIGTALLPVVQMLLKECENHVNPNMAYESDTLISKP
jgi:transcriptional regulator with XRE-family HTH domain